MKTPLDYIRELLQTEPRVLATIDHPRLDHTFRGCWQSRDLLVPTDCVVWIVGAKTSAPFDLLCDGVRLIIGCLIQAGDLREFTTFHRVPPRQNYNVRLEFVGVDPKPLGQVHLYGWMVPYKQEDYDALFRPKGG